MARTLQGLALQNDFAVAKICQSQTQFDDTSTEKLSLLLAQRLVSCVCQSSHITADWTDDELCLMLISRAE